MDLALAWSLAIYWTTREMGTVSTNDPLNYEPTLFLSFQSSPFFLDCKSLILELVDHSCCCCSCEHHHLYLIRFLTPLATLFLYRQYRHTGRDFQSRSDKREQTLNRTEWLTADRPTAYRCSYTPIHTSAKRMACAHLCTTYHVYVQLRSTTLCQIGRATFHEFLVGNRLYRC